MEQTHKSLNQWRHYRDRVINRVISVIFHNDNLIGISVGRIKERTYYPQYEVVPPASLYHDESSYIGQIKYLRSEVLKYLLSKGLIDKSEVVKISNNSTGHDEF